MAKAVQQFTLGIDVSKHELIIHGWESGEYTTLSNEPDAIRSWLSSLVVENKGG